MLYSNLRTLRAAVLLPALATSCLTANAALVAAPPKAPLPFREALAKKFGGKGVFGAIMSISQSDESGKKSDGGIWWVATKNDKTLFKDGYDEPQKWLTARCVTDGGTFATSMAFKDIASKDVQPDVSITDPNTGSLLKVTPLTLYRSGAMLARYDVYDQIPLTINDAASKYLGLFSCNAGAGKSLWHVAVVPAIKIHIVWDEIDRNLKGPQSVKGHQVFRTVDTPNYRDMMLSVRVIDATYVRSFQEILAKEQATESVRTANAADKEKRRQEFVSKLEVGAETNCGLVLTVKGPIVEIQLPSNSRTFMKRSTLDLPKAHGGARCPYEPPQ